MHIQTVIDNLERTIKGKQQLKEAGSKDALISRVIEINIGELEKILADVKKVRDFSGTPVPPTARGATRVECKSRKGFETDCPNMRMTDSDHDTSDDYACVVCGKTASIHYTEL